MLFLEKVSGRFRKIQKKKIVSNNRPCITHYYHQYNKAHRNMSCQSTENQTFEKLKLKITELFMTENRISANTIENISITLCWT